VSDCDGVSLGDCEVLAVTDRAILVLTPDFGEEWIPKSQIHDDSELYDGAAVGWFGQMVVSEWLAGERGWA
jgi:hypothetical protein